MRGLPQPGSRRGRRTCPIECPLHVPPDGAVDTAAPRLGTYRRQLPRPARPARRLAGPVAPLPRRVRFPAGPLPRPPRRRPGHARPARRAADRLVLHRRQQEVDFLLSIGIEPFVVLSFTPSALASGSATVFSYRANVAPPADPASGPPWRRGWRPTTAPEDARSQGRGSCLCRPPRGSLSRRGVNETFLFRSSVVMRRSARPALSRSCRDVARLKPSLARSYRWSRELLSAPRMSPASTAKTSRRMGHPPCRHRVDVGRSEDHGRAGVQARKACGGGHPCQLAAVGAVPYVRDPRQQGFAPGGAHQEGEAHQITDTEPANRLAQLDVLDAHEAPHLLDVLEDWNLAHAGPFDSRK